jgi:hypothetical protein
MRSAAVLTVFSTLFFLGASAAPVVANLEQRTEAPCERSYSGGLLNDLSLLSGNEVGTSPPLPFLFALASHQSIHLSSQDRADQARPSPNVEGSGNGNGNSNGNPSDFLNGNGNPAPTGDGNGTYCAHLASVDT